MGMSISARTIRRDIRGFVSEVKRELACSRKFIKKALEVNSDHATEPAQPIGELVLQASSSGSYGVPIGRTFATFLRRPRAFAFALRSGLGGQMVENNHDAPVDGGTFWTRPAWLTSHRALPFQDLSDDQFEVFNYLLLLKEHPGDEIIYYGKTGDRGRDIVRRLTDGTHEIIQCKRYRMNIGVSEIRDELAKLYANIFEKHCLPFRLALSSMWFLTLPARRLNSSAPETNGSKSARRHSKSFWGTSQLQKLVDFARTWSPELSHVEQHKLTERACRFPNLVEEFFEIRQSVSGSLDEIKPRLTSIEERVVRILGLVPDLLKEQLTSVDQNLEVYGGRLRRWLVAIAAVVLAALGTLGYVGWRQEREGAVQERERVAAESSRKNVETNLTSVNTKLDELRKQFADPDVLVGKIKSHIRTRADEEIAAARAKRPDDWRKREAIEKSAIRPWNECWTSSRQFARAWPASRIQSSWRRPKSSTNKASMRPSSTSNRNSRRSIRRSV